MPLRLGCRSAIWATLVGPSPRVRVTYGPKRGPPRGGPLDFPDTPPSRLWSWTLPPNEIGHLCCARPTPRVKLVGEPDGGNLQVRDPLDFPDTPQGACGRAKTASRTRLYADTAADESIVTLPVKSRQSFQQRTAGCVNGRCNSQTLCLQPDRGRGTQSQPAR